MYSHTERNYFIIILMQIILLYLSLKLFNYILYSILVIWYVKYISDEIILSFLSLKVFLLCLSYYKKFRYTS